VIRDFVNTVPAVRITFFGPLRARRLPLDPETDLNLGLRRDLFTTPVEAFNRQSNWSPLTGLIDVASSNNRPPNLSTYFRNWGPRVGLAYSPDNGRTAIRAA
jgi:outer membrane receptor protein involved in Fe transport